MNAIILAAGYGTRLRPLTESIPKCLVPIGGVALLDIWLEQLFNSGVQRVLINTHYKYDLVERHIRQSKFNNEIDLVYEEVLLGTAGTLLNNLSFFNDNDGILLHGDNYTRTDLTKFIDFHKRRPKDVDLTILTFRTDNPLGSGIFRINRHGKILSFHEKSSGDYGDLANGAIYCLSSRLIEDLAKTKVQDFSTEVLPNYLKRSQLFIIDDYFLDIGNLQSFSLAQIYESNVRYLF